jgi:hypothetical protein
MAKKPVPEPQPVRGPREETPVTADDLRKIATAFEQWSIRFKGVAGLVDELPNQTLQTKNWKSLTDGLQMVSGATTKVMAAYDAQLLAGLPMGRADETDQG